VKTSPFLFNKEIVTDYDLAPKVEVGKMSKKSEDTCKMLQNLQTVTFTKEYKES
jgi:hypothetical protein